MRADGGADGGSDSWVVGGGAVRGFIGYGVDCGRGGAGEGGGAGCGSTKWVVLCCVVLGYTVCAVLRCMCCVGVWVWWKMVGDDLPQHPAQQAL